MPDTRFTRRRFLFLSLSILLLPAQFSPAAELRDPTRPPAVPSHTPAAAAPAEEPLALLGTLVSQGRRIAIIDGRAIAQGGSIKGARLIRVEEGEAVLKRNGREHTLRVSAARQSEFRKSVREDQP